MVSKMGFVRFGTFLEHSLSSGLFSVKTNEKTPVAFCRNWISRTSVLYITYTLPLVFVGDKLPTQRSCQSDGFLDR